LEQACHNPVGFGGVSLLGVRNSPMLDVNSRFRTDPATFDLYLVNQAVNPSVSTLVASDIDTSTGSYTIKANNKDLTNSDTGYHEHLFRIRAYNSN
jgi:hypothetical protein